MKPNKLGCYWYRWSISAKWEPVEVFEKNGELLFTRYNLTSLYSVLIDTDNFNWGGPQPSIIARFQA